VAPVIDENNQVIGATIVFFPTDYVQTTVRQQIQLTALVAGIVLLTGILTSIVLSRRQAEPVERITRAAKDVENGNFNPDVLDSVLERQDELGKLAQIFTSMAIEVQSREQRLRRQVEALRIEVDESKKELQVAEITESEYFHNIQERAQEIRTRRSEEKLYKEKNSENKDDSS
jgi:nitrogen fixation/metabolism regulation signal transduction histidine kinase